MNELIPKIGDLLNREKRLREEPTAFLEMVHHFPDLVFGPSLHS